MTGSVDVCLVVVTYSDRGSLLRNVLQEAVNQGCRHIVIVDNGSSSALSDIAAEVTSREEVSWEILAMGQNAGSQKAVLAGLAAALRSGTSFTLILDDDNVAAQGAIARLIDTASSSNNPRACVAGRRSTSSLHRLLVQGRSVRDVFPRRSSYLGFDLAQTVRRKLRVARSAPTVQSLLPYSAYGGLLLKRAAVEDVLLNQAQTADYLLYEDDSLLTALLVQRGGNIVFEPRAELIDIDSKWYESDGERGGNRWRNLLNAKPDFRLFYAVRNRAHFDRHVYRDSTWRFVLNRAIFWLIFSILADRGSGASEVIRSAARSGEHGRLGAHPDYPLPGSR